MVSTQESFSANVIVDQKNLGDSFFALNKLLPATTYFWRVRCFASAGDTTLWATFSFSTAPLAPVAPVQVSPPNGSSVVTDPLTFWWNLQAFAQTYQVQISPSPSFFVTLVDSAGIMAESLLVAGLPSGTNLFWRMRATNKTGTGPWSLT